MIEVGVWMCQYLGIPRSIGQIYGLLYLSVAPLSTDAIAESLGISKATVSMGTRMLLAWRAIRLSWTPGERRDHFEIEPDLTNLLRISYRDVVQRRFAVTQDGLGRICATLEVDHINGAMTSEDYEACSDRLKVVTEIQKKLAELLPLLEKLF
jgi:DNA-binding transcriptional regulator GbsR (MarR family)